MGTYKALLKFAKDCPCACPSVSVAGPPTRTQTQKRPKTYKWVRDELMDMFPGRDVRTGDTDKKRRIAYYGR
jgi:hypothetical protein